MKKKYIAIGAVAVVLLGYGLLANNSEDGTQETGQATEQVTQNNENEQEFVGGVRLIQ